MICYDSCGTLLHNMTQSNRSSKIVQLSSHEHLHFCLGVFLEIGEAALHKKARYRRQAMIREMKTCSEKRHHGRVLLVMLLKWNVNVKGKCWKPLGLSIRICRAFTLLLIFSMSCRSPDIELVADRGSIGGWGLGGGHEEKTRLGQEEDEDEPPSDWDQAQVCLIDMLKF